MTSYAVPPMEIPAVPIAGSDEVFPVRRIYCVGRNYAEHAREMGSDPDREPPFFFMKPTDTIIQDGADFPYPSMSENVHYEMELVVAIGTGGKDIPQGKANDHIFGYACGLDMTRRDLQGEAKKMGRPWEIGKAFEHSAPIGPIESVFETGHPECGVIALDVNGTRRQEGDLAQMIWKVPEMISYLSEYFELAAGDVILSGTPSGVGPVERGQTMEMACEGLGAMTVKVV